MAGGFFINRLLFRRGCSVVDGEAGAQVVDLFLDPGCAAVEVLGHFPHPLGDAHHLRLLEATGGDGGGAPACRAIQECFIRTEVNQSHKAVSVSIGVAEFRKKEPPAQLLDRADAALYRAKQNKGSICFEF